MEDAALGPMTLHLRQFEEFLRDREAAYWKQARMSRAEDIAKIRPALVKILTESALVKNTTIPKRFLKHWDEWKQIEDRHDLLSRLGKIRKDLTKLREREAELMGEHQELSDADRRHMEALKFELDVGEFQLVLVEYEKQSWKQIKENAPRLKQMRVTFSGLTRTFQTLLDHPYTERLHRLVQSWPALAPVKIKGVDLLACKRDKAEETVASLLKTPDAPQAGRKKIRRLRMLAESYPIQRRLFQLAFTLRQASHLLPFLSPPDDAVDTVLPDLVGPVGRRPQRTDPSLGTERLLKAEVSFARAKQRLLQTWIDYQMVRLDLYGDVGLPR